MAGNDDDRGSKTTLPSGRPGAAGALRPGPGPTSTQGRSGESQASGQAQDDFLVKAPSISAPKGGGAIRGIGEKFQANPVTGTAGLTVPIGVSPGRGGFTPELVLSYDSGSGNGPFGHGWKVAIASIRRKTDKGLPLYRDGGASGAPDSDVFVFSEAEDLVPVVGDGDPDELDPVRDESIVEAAVSTPYRVERFRPRAEGGFSRIERWVRKSDSYAWWRTVSKANVERIYGRSSNARVVDLDQPSRCFEWLLERAMDEVGNVITYEYKVEDRVGVPRAIYETPRLVPGNTPTYVYPKRIKYGNSTPFGAPEWSQFHAEFGTAPLDPGVFHFEVVFDYGEHDAEAPTPDDEAEGAEDWTVRQDPFSSFRSGFDLRCYRLCRRILMFHHFTTELGSDPVIVRSTELAFNDAPPQAPHLTKLMSVTQRGWRTEGTLTSLAMPPVEFTYSEPVIGQEVRFVTGLEDLPPAFDVNRWQWVDLDGEGISGLLTEQGNGWFYKRNEGDGVLGATQNLSARPSIGLQGGARLMDLGGDGRLDLVSMRRPLAGSVERARDGSWGHFKPFQAVPEVDWSHPNVRMIDLDGDGHADLVVTEDDAFRWYRSRARDGFEAPRRTAKSRDEDKGPALIFQSESESIFLADMTGDGLTDLVRVRVGSICYWPNRGHGKFGSKITLQNCPWLDHPDRFDPKRVQLADVDGSGPADLIYIGPDKVRMWWNRSGNSFGPEIPLDRIPSVHSAATITTSDVLGDGTACLLWSSKLLSDRFRPLRYVQLMAEGKPHLLTSYKNNLGRETRFTYASSTKFYLADRRAGRPWATRLHFPVQVLEKVEVLDHVTGWRFANTYAYHHGSYDGGEREFRGFGLVEQRDTESFSDFEEAVAANAKGSVTTTPTMRVTTYEIGAGAFTGTAYDLVLKQDLVANYFVLIDGLQAASPQQASNVGVRVTADPFHTGDLGTSSGEAVLELARGDNADGDWVGTVTVVECLADATASGFTLIDVKEVVGGTASSPETINDTANAEWSELTRVVLYGGPRGGGASVASGDATSQGSLFGKLTPSGTDTITLKRHGGGVDLLAATFTVYVVEWGEGHRIERIEVAGSTGSLGFDTTAIPSPSVTTAKTWVWASGYTEDNDAGNGFLGLLVALGDGTTPGTTETSVAVGCKFGVARDVLVTVHSHDLLLVQHEAKAEGDGGAATYPFEVDDPLAAETYQEVGPVKSTRGTRLGLLTTSHDDSSGDVEGARFAVRPRGNAADDPGSETVIEARRTESGGAWAARLQVVDFGALKSSVARTNVQVDFFSPAVLTRTWFHTGVWLDGPTLESAYAAEAWSGDVAAMKLKTCVLPSELAPTDRREAARALKGKMLRQEIYAEDGKVSDDVEGGDNTDATNPYVITENRYEVRTVQERGTNRFGVYLTVPLESITRQYERLGQDYVDPRVQHQLTVEVDEFGEVLQQVTVAYGRRPGSALVAPQDDALVTLAVRAPVHEPGNAHDYHVGLAGTEQVWELGGSTQVDTDPYTASELSTAFGSATPVNFGTAPGATQKRKLSETRTLYWNDVLSGALSLGTVELRALVHQTYQMAIPSSFVTGAFGGNATDALLGSAGAGFVQPDGTDTDWYRPSGTSTLDPDHFYLPTEVTDPWGNDTAITWDDHDLLVEEVEDALSNVVAAANDYQVLGPWQVTDPNGNKQEVAFDELGRVTKTAVMNSDSSEGDLLADHPTTTVTYELDRWMDNDLPARTTVETRETHYNPGTVTAFRTQVVAAYSDGGGNVVLSKQKAWPGDAPMRDGSGDLVAFGTAPGQLVVDYVDERWIGSGRVQVDNKGNPVRQYEPFFSSTEEYEDEVQLVEMGVSPTLRYDPLGRKVRVDHPDGTYEKVEFDAWTQRSYDRCDTVIDSDWYDDRDPGDREVAASVEHDDTPSVAHLDPLGRTFLTEETPDDGTTTYETRLALDILGRTLSVTDAKGAVATTTYATQEDVYDALGRSVHTTSADAGETWMLADLAGQPSVTWKTGDVKVEQTYDALRRPRATIVTEGVADPRVHVFNVYGEFTDAPGATANTLGRLWRQYDGAGLVETEYDFKGNVISTERTFLDDVDTEVDWTDLLDDADVGDLDSTASGDLQGTSYSTTMTYDALNRVVTSTTPDTSVTRNTWNEGGLLEKVEVQVRGDSTWTPMVGNIDYNARGQRTAIVYSENAGETDGAFTTAYDYHPETFRLTRLRTIRENDGKRLQDLKYVYDACGNIVQITDDAQQTIFFDNAWADPVMLYRYDSLYRLISAQGREHASHVQPGAGNPDVEHFIADGASTLSYFETYEYDEVGNILEIVHNGGSEGTPGTHWWTRTYTYEETSNRLLTTTIPDAPYTVSYTHNDRGAMTVMPHLAGITRQFDDQIRSVDINGTDEAVYHYDAGGNRVRKVVRLGANTEERLYVGAWELFQSSTTTLQEERETLHVMDDKRRIAMIETLTTTGGSEVTTPTPLFRFQLGNHLESASLEVDEDGDIISYEEFFPYGSTAWWATASGTDVSAKRYRYTGKERDDETGLGYHGARYYAAWLARWERPDPSGIKSGLNRYEYVKGRPVGSFDPTGNAEVPSEAVLGPQVLYPVGFVGPLPSGAGHEAYPGQGSIPAALRPGRDALWNAANPIPEPRDSAVRGPGGVALLGRTEWAYDMQAQMQAGQIADTLGTQSTSPGGAIAGGVATALGAGQDKVGAASKVGAALEVVGGAVAVSAGAVLLGKSRLGDPKSTLGEGRLSLPDAESGRLGNAPRGYLQNNYNPRYGGNPDFAVTVGPEKGSYIFAEGSIVGKGILETSVSAKAARNLGYSNASGGFAFQSIVKAAEATGELNAIRGVWVEGDNLAAFRKAGGGPGASEATNLGAARATWTAQEAAKAGYTDVELEAVTNTMVQVLFTKPGGG